MRILRTPVFYSQFRCIAGACPDSCCKEWDVQVDDGAAALYRTLPGSLGDRLRQVLRDTEDGTVMTIEDGRCPMWRQDGLCRIQAELGEAALCRTCREFPRLTHDYGDFVEYQLELSCPEAARLILSDPVCLVTETQLSGDGEPEYDPETMALLLRSRDAACGLLSDIRYTPGQRLAGLLLYAYSVQDALDLGEPLPPEPMAIPDIALSPEAPAPLRLLPDFFAGLEILTPQWRSRLDTLPPLSDWDPETPALARYLVRRYWLQAISDSDLVCRVKFTVAACILVRLLGGNFREAAQLFSKEIENDVDNLDAILDAAYTHPAFTDCNLLCWLGL